MCTNLQLRVRAVKGAIQPHLTIGCMYAHWCTLLACARAVSLRSEHSLLMTRRGTPVMTIKVYRLHGTSRRRREIRRLTVPNGDPERIPDSLALPPCTCPRCRPDQ